MARSSVKISLDQYKDLDTLRRKKASFNKFQPDSFLLIPSLMVNLPDDWQDNFTGADNPKCLTLYPSEDDLNLLLVEVNRVKRGRVIMSSSHLIEGDKCLRQLGQWGKFEAF